jgi:hypothetical protein
MINKTKIKMENCYCHNSALEIKVDMLIESNKIKNI